MTAGRDFAVLFIALGALAAAGEFRHKTAVPTFLATPRRSKVLVGKVTAQACVGLLIAAACVTVQLTIALPSMRGVTPLDASVAEPVLVTLVSGVVYAALGVGLGTLLRSQVPSRSSSPSGGSPWLRTCWPTSHPAPPASFPVASCPGPGRSTSSPRPRGWRCWPRTRRSWE